MNSEVNFEDLNVNLSFHCLSVLTLIYGTWLVEIANEINCVSYGIKVIQNTKFSKSQKLKCNKTKEPQNCEINVAQKFHVTRYLITLLY